MSASGGEIEYEKRLVRERFEIFESRSNRLVHGNLGSLHLQVKLLRHAVCKGIATERSNFFLQFGFFFLLFFESSLTQFLDFLLVTLADRSQRILRERKSDRRVSNLGYRFLDTQNEIVDIKFSLELVTDCNKLVCKLETEQVRELGVVRRITSNRHCSTRRSRSLCDRQSLRNRIHISLDLFLVAFGQQGAIGAKHLVAGTGDYRVTLAHGLQRIRSHLNLEVRILIRLYIIVNRLQQGIFIEFFAHLARNNRKVLATELGTQHIGELLVVGRICGNCGRCLFNSLFAIASHKTKSSQSSCTKSNFLHVHMYLLREIFSGE